MTNWLRRLIASKKSARPHGSVRLEIETLEDRRTPTITYHGGNLMPHVEAQALYLGSDWSSNSTYSQQRQTLDGFIKTLVGGAYMDMLTNAGYNVGRGSADAGKTAPIPLDKGAALSDEVIQAYVQSYIGNGILKPPNANRLYLVVVEPDILVRTSDGLLSRTDFLGYHGAFAGHDPRGKPADIRYAVVAYPGGSIGNAAVAGLSAINSMTEVISHEIVEAVTDPDIAYGALAWYDDARDEEAADIVNQQYVFLDGFAVQRVADRNDQAMTPAGAISSRPVSFVLLADGRLYEHTSGGWTYLRAGVASVSGQGIDNAARAMVDVVLTSGEAYEYHDGGVWTFLKSGVKDARAGQGVSYVLLNNGNVYEYLDDTRMWSRLIASGATAIDAGTDHYGVNMVDVLFASGALVEYSDTSGRHVLRTGVKAVSAGLRGVSVALLTDGRAYQYNDLTGAWTYLAANVAQIATGTAVGGGALVAVVSTNGSASQIRAGFASSTFATGVKSIGKPRAGLIDVVFSNGGAYEHTPTGWIALCGTAKQAA